MGEARKRDRFCFAVEVTPKELFDVTAEAPFTFESPTHA